MLSTKQTVTAVILAGGKSRRMGENKAFLRLGNCTLIEHVIQKIECISDELLIISNNPQEYTHLGIQTHSDIIKNVGTLGGIHAGLSYATNDITICVGCDNPFLDSNLLLYLVSRLGEHDAVVPYTYCENENITLQTLCAVYSKRCLPIIEQMLNDAELRVHALKEHANLLRINPNTWKEFDPEGHSFFNVNTPEDFDNAKVLYNLLQ